MSNGQPYYRNEPGSSNICGSRLTLLAIYELAPYRLATVAGGCFVGFIW